MTDQIPLVVDYDGTYIRGDSLHEMIAISLKHPKKLIGAVVQFFRKGKPGLKHYLASQISSHPDSFPLNNALQQYLLHEKKQGRTLVLATGANQAFAELVSSQHDLFDRVVGSTKTKNLTGINKKRLLTEEFGVNGFDYVGNSKVDLPIWQVANKRYLATPRLTHSAQKLTQNIDFEKIFVDEKITTAKLWAKQLRLHQTLKNLLLFLPLIAAHKFDDPVSWLKVAIGFVLFSMVAFSVYLLNDIFDLESDRQHQRKMNRPIAAGLILPLHGLAASIFLVFAGLTGAFILSLGFGAILFVYLALTVLYTFWVKRIAILDVIFLGILYLLRIVGGAILADIHLTFWFAAIAFFLFLSLAISKRYSEISNLNQTTKNISIPGRGYGSHDEVVVLSLGVGSGLVTVLLFTIYIQTDSVSLLYPSNGFLWLAIPGLFYWISNLWLSAGRGELSDDPVVFALSNRRSIGSSIYLLVIFVIASSDFAGDLAEKILP